MTTKKNSILLKRYWVPLNFRFISSSIFQVPSTNKFTTPLPTQALSFRNLFNFFSVFKKTFSDDSNEQLFKTENLLKTIFFMVAQLAKSLSKVKMGQCFHKTRILNKISWKMHWLSFFCGAFKLCRWFWENSIKMLLILIHSRSFVWRIFDKSLLQNNGIYLCIWYKIKSVSRGCF